MIIFQLLNIYFQGFLGGDHNSEKFRIFLGGGVPNIFELGIKEGNSN